MIDISRVTIATPEVADGIGRIMPFLDEHHNGTPIDLSILRHTVESPSAVQLVATITEHDPSHIWDIARAYPIVGAAAVSTLHGSHGEKAWLEDFVITPDVSKFGTAQLLWDAMTEWRIERGLYQMRFNSSSDKVRAHGFYRKNGCDVLAEGKTTLFVHNIDK